MSRGRAPDGQRGGNQPKGWGLPVAVYGTLRPGQGNAGLWERCDAAALFDGDATVPGFRLVSSRKESVGGFPYAIPDARDGAEIVVALIDAPDVTWDQMLARMDALEGYPRHYGRQIVTALTPVGPMRAWIYVPAWPCDFEDHHPIPGGDWVAARKAAR